MIFAIESPSQEFQPTCLRDGASSLFVTTCVSLLRLPLFDDVVRTFEVGNTIPSTSIITSGTNGERSIVNFVLTTISPIRDRSPFRLCMCRICQSNIISRHLWLHSLSEVFWRFYTRHYSTIQCCSLFIFIDDCSWFENFSNPNFYGDSILHQNYLSNFEVWFDFVFLWLGWLLVQSLKNSLEPCFEVLPFFFFFFESTLILRKTSSFRLVYRWRTIPWGNFWIVFAFSLDNSIYFLFRNFFGIGLDILSCIFHIFWPYAK